MVKQAEEKLYWENGVYLGDVIMGVDGYFTFWPDRSRSGGWGEDLLMAIAIYLIDLNKEWDKKVKDGLAEANGGK